MLSIEQSSCRPGAVRLNAAIKRLRDALGLYPSPHPPPLPPPPGRRRRRELHPKTQQNGVRLWSELSLIRNLKLGTANWKLLSVARNKHDRPVRGECASKEIGAGESVHVARGGQGERIEGHARAVRA